jgi:ubiquinone/menaquinone biosynthesis C-methylase UbiE
MLLQSPCLEAFLTRSIPRSANGVLMTPIATLTDGIIANQTYFDHPTWGSDYFHACHRSASFKARWKAAIGDWRGKIVVDICCGPGNVGASLREVLGQPEVLIGVDIAPAALAHAQDFGYSPVYADAQNLPFVSGFADLVVINAGLHHCDDMAQALREAARIVKPGGILIADHDPQKTAWPDTAIARLIWRSRLPLYRLLRRGGHSTAEEQHWHIKTELHHRPGDGVTAAWFEQQLAPLGFDVRTYPHNNTGATALQGEFGQPEWKSRLAQWLTGIDSRTPEAALVLMCIAKRSPIRQAHGIA